jgi:hypothetical protein
MTIICPRILILNGETGERGKMADDFDDFLIALNEVEIDAERKEVVRFKQEAIANYTDWASHFELVKRNFTETYNLFGTIADKVANWRKKWGDVMKSDLEGYRFETGIYRYSMTAEMSDKLLEVDCCGLGDERLLRFGYVRNDSEVPEMLVGLENLSERLLTPKNTEPLIAKLSTGMLGFRLYAPCGNLVTNKNVGIGYLYEHSLADACKELFKMMSTTNPATWETGLGLIIPEGEYSIRRTNFMSMLDDNTILPENDPRWRNG